MSSYAQETLKPLGRAFHDKRVADLEKKAKKPEVPKFSRASKPVRFGSQQPSNPSKKESKESKESRGGYSVYPPKQPSTGPKKKTSSNISNVGAKKNQTYKSRGVRVGGTVGGNLSQPTEIQRLEKLNGTLRKENEELDEKIALLKEILREE